MRPYQTNKLQKQRNSQTPNPGNYYQNINYRSINVNQNIIAVNSNGALKNNYMGLVGSNIKIRPKDQVPIYTKTSPSDLNDLNNPTTPVRLRSTTNLFQHEQTDPFLKSCILFHQQHSHRVKEYYKYYVKGCKEDFWEMLGQCMHHAMNLARDYIIHKNILKNQNKKVENQGQFLSLISYIQSLQKFRELHLDCWNQNCQNKHHQDNCQIKLQKTKKIGLASQQKMQQTQKNLKKPKQQENLKKQKQKQKQKQKKPKPGVTVTTAKKPAQKNSQKTKNNNNKTSKNENKKIMPSMAAQKNKSKQPAHDEKHNESQPFLNGINRIDNQQEKAQSIVHVQPIPIRDIFYIPNQERPITSIRNRQDSQRRDTSQTKSKQNLRPMTREKLLAQENKYQNQQKKKEEELKQLQSIQKMGYFLNPQEKRKKEQAKCQIHNYKQKLHTLQQQIDKQKKKPNKKY